MDALMRENPYLDPQWEDFLSVHLAELEADFLDYRHGRPLSLEENDHGFSWRFAAMKTPLD